VRFQCDVGCDYDGDISARREAGNKYFLKRNLALDFQAGYSVQLNKVDHHNFFIQVRSSSIKARLALSFVF
jgi:hypothetical protein